MSILPALKGWEATALAPPPGTHRSGGRLARYTVGSSVGRIGWHGTLQAVARHCRQRLSGRGPRMLFPAGCVAPCGAREACDGQRSGQRKVLGIPLRDHLLAASKAARFELATTRLVVLTAWIPLPFQREPEVRD